MHRHHQLDIENPVIGSQKLKLKLKKKVRDDLLRAFGAEDENGEEQRILYEMTIAIEIEIENNGSAIVMSDD